MPGLDVVASAMHQGFLCIVEDSLGIGGVAFMALLGSSSAPQIMHIVSITASRAACSQAAQTD